MRRWVIVIAAVALAATAPSAHAAAKLGHAVLLRCGDGVATFEGRVTPLPHALRTQLRFALQARTPEEPEWRTISAPGFGSWITAPTVGRYLYDKTVEGLLAPADYRAVVQFRWRDARGRTVRAERAISKLCNQPDPRANLEVTALKVGARYVAVVINGGRGDAGPFAVAFTRNGVSLGTVVLTGLAAGETTTAVLTGAPACAAGELIAAQADSGEGVEEVDEEANVLSVTC
jgi:hypothetical protein